MKEMSQSQQLIVPNMEKAEKKTKSSKKAGNEVDPYSQIRMSFTNQNQKSITHRGFNINFDKSNDSFKVIEDPSPIMLKPRHDIRHESVHTKFLASPEI